MAEKSKPVVEKTYYTKVDRDNTDKWALAAVADHKPAKHALSGLKKATPKPQKGK